MEVRKPLQSKKEETHMPSCLQKSVMNDSNVWTRHQLFSLVINFRGSFQCFIGLRDVIKQQLCKVFPENVGVKNVDEIHGGTAACVSKSIQSMRQITKKSHPVRIDKIIIK